MLLIAIIGEKGSGKSTLAARLAEWYRTEGRRVDGFWAEAGARPVPGKGADSYTLRWAATNQWSPLARRLPDGTPGVPYAFEPETLAATEAWAAGLGEAPRADLIVLDEFGLLESEGGGHMAIWPQVAAADPGIVAIGVRAQVAEAISERLGRPFDVTVSADSPEAWEQLRAACLAHRDWTRVGLYGAGAGTLEMTLGAALHGGMVPFRGLVMASAQASVMTWSAHGLGERGRVVWVPFIAAGLKALSPTGNRLRPMLAITVQGLLYAGVTRTLGWNRVSVAVASAAVGAWAAAQGLVLQYLFVGKELLRAYEAVVGWAERLGGVSPPAIATAIGAWIALWALVAGIAGALAFGRTSSDHSDALDRLAAWRSRFGGAMPDLGAERAKPSWHQALRAGLGDLARPTFWLPLAIVVAVIVAAGSPWEAAFWVVARAATVGVLLFTAVRFLDVAGAVAALRRRGQWGPAVALARALQEIGSAGARRSP
jgi:nucleoside-triphosphatase THEP1